KTSSSASKRFKITGSGKLKRNKAYTGHNFTSKTKKQKRNLRKSTIVHSSNHKNIKTLLNF
ncbi:50S ribosomal protein L35, partial [bacterium]|nr:50S ribosomal protein L35 [bacterium]